MFSPSPECFGGSGVPAGSKLTVSSSSALADDPNKPCNFVDVSTASVVSEAEGEGQSCYADTGDEALKPFFVCKSTAPDCGE